MGSISAQGKFVQQADDRLIQKDLEDARVAQALKKRVSDRLPLRKVIALDKCESKLIRPPHDALKLVEDRISVCWYVLGALSRHRSLPALIEDGASWCAWAL
jgi:hypothetical protein